MALSRLVLVEFRSYAEALIEPGPRLVVLTGENGAGKTNILEAVSLLAPGRGMRGAALGEMARNGGPGGFSVAARLRSPPVSLIGGGRSLDVATSARDPLEPPAEEEGPIELGTGTVATAPERRLVRINTAPAPATALSEWLSIVWLTPAMDRLFAEPAGGRRRFLDRLVLALEPGHAAHATRYEAAMRARNRLLASDAPDADWLTALEAQMADHGIPLSDARARTVAALNEQLMVQPDHPFARAGLALEGWAAADPVTIRAGLARDRARDAAAGRTLTGPHRVDLRVTHFAKQQPAERCSTGEQKALLLGIVLAHADLVAERVRRRPILLLDEVAAHLDPRRRAALFERLGAGGGQVWMTGTEASLFTEAPAGAQRFTVLESVVRPA